MNRRIFALVIAVVSLGPLAAPSVARANGDTAHAWITTRALDLLPEGSLKQLLSRPELREALINGCAYPDGGYIVHDAYGEMAHWEPFVEAYIEWVRATYPGKLTSDGAKHVAFLMGVASHDIADETFDACFAPAAQIHDAAGWSDDLLQDHDSNTDLILVAQTHARFDDVQPWVPAADLSALYHDRFQYEISADALTDNQDLLRKLTLSYAPLTDAATRQQAADRYPWSAAHLMQPTEPGAPPDQAVVVAAYWLAVWDRLHDVHAEQNFIIGTHPRDGAGGHVTDHALVESQLVIAFGHGVETRRFAGKIEVRDDAGHVQPVDVSSPWNTDVTNVLRIRPRQDWPADRDFTVTLSPGVAAIDGLALAAPFTFEFSTRAAAASAATSDPTPHVGDFEPEAPAGGDGGKKDDGGCSTGGDAAPLIGLALLLVRRGSRRRKRAR